MDPIGDFLMDMIEHGAGFANVINAVFKHASPEATHTETTTLKRSLRQWAASNTLETRMWFVAWGMIITGTTFGFDAATRPDAIYFLDHVYAYVTAATTGHGDVFRAMHSLWLMMQTQRRQV